MRALIFLALGSLAACGGAEELGTSRVSLRMNAIPCDNGIPGLQAELGVPDHPACPLEVGADRTITGVCPSITAGRAYEVRLAYFVQLPPDTRVDIARIYQTVDLREPADATVVLTFPDAALETNIDSDSDNVDNIDEVCAGRDPLMAGQ
jgi:hypothetical protein